MGEGKVIASDESLPNLILLGKPQKSNVALKRKKQEEEGEYRKEKEKYIYIFLDTLAQLTLKQDVNNILPINHAELVEM